MLALRSHVAEAAGASSSKAQSAAERRRAWSKRPKRATEFCYPYCLCLFWY